MGTALSTAAGRPLGDGHGLEGLVAIIRPLFAGEPSLARWVALRGAVTIMSIHVWEHGTEAQLRLMGVMGLGWDRESDGSMTDLVCTADLPAWRTSRRPAAASEGSSARFATPAASEIAPQVPLLPRARSWEATGGPEVGPGVSGGRQRSSRMVPCTRSTQLLVWGRPARLKRCWAPVTCTARRTSWERNSEPLSVETACGFQPAAAGSAAIRRTRTEVWQAAGLSGVTWISAHVTDGSVGRSPRSVSTCGRPWPEGGDRDGRGAPHLGAAHYRPPTINRLFPRVLT
jgi:hypothetical protein